MTPLVQPFQDPADRFPPVRLDRANVAAAEHRDVVGLVAFDEPTLQGNWDQAIIRVEDMLDAIGPASSWAAFLARASPRDARPMPPC
jgi:hypothetical protein